MASLGRPKSPPPGAPAAADRSASEGGAPAPAAEGIELHEADPLEAHEADPLEAHGPGYLLRYARAADAPRLFELASDPLVTRFFSWGPYTRLDQPEGYIASLAAKRARGELLDFLVVSRTEGPVGVTGLSELSARDRRATVGSWLGRAYWGSGANLEAKALICALAFGPLRLERVTAWANVTNGRSQAALERVGFRREGVLAAWHRHGDQVHDVVVFGLVRAAWEASALASVPVDVRGTPPPAFVAG